MEYGCIGEHLTHSFSKEIHAELAPYSYTIREIPRNELDAFMTHRDFLGINVTIPYKEAVIPYLDVVDDAAQAIGAVNTIVNRNGKLYGYNTDYFGLSSVILRAGITLKDKKVVILGTGGTSKTAAVVARDLGAASIYHASRREGAHTISYEALRRQHTDTDIIINATPVGMYPNTSASPVSLDGFDRLSGVVDVVYNPLRTELIQSAMSRGIKTATGLYMLVAQAARAFEIFTDTKVASEKTEQVYEAIRRKKENIVLIGMPASGKTTVGRLLSEMLGREFIDTDDLIEKATGETIPNIFATRGEDAFRHTEAQIVESLTPLNGKVIATGGGAILRETNVNALKKNGRLYFLDRPLSMLASTDDRPTASSPAEMERRYHERYAIYKSVADRHIDGGGSAKAVANLIMEDMTV